MSKTSNKISEENLHMFRITCETPMRFFEKNITYVNIKRHKTLPPKLISRRYIFRKAIKGGGNSLFMVKLIINFDLVSS